MQTQSIAIHSTEVRLFRFFPMENHSQMVYIQVTGIHGSIARTVANAER
jgi:hypothetical protein